MNPPRPIVSAYTIDPTVSDELRRLREDLTLATKRADESQRNAHDERTTKLATAATQKVEMIKQRIDEIVQLGRKAAPK